MDIKEFVQNTLEQIAQGVAEARISFKACGGEINPSKYNYSNSSSVDTIIINSTHKQTAVSMVEFDLMVAEEKTTDKGLKASVVLNVIGAHGGWEKNVSGSNVNRVKFSVPVVMPSQG